MKQMTRAYAKEQPYDMMAGAFAAVAAHVVAAAKRMQEKARIEREMRYLAQAPDSVLKDIGITRDDVMSAYYGQR